MSYLPFIFGIVIADFLAVCTPGPDFVLTLRNTLKGSRACGIATAVGISTGIAIHVAYSTFGVAALLTKFDNISLVLKILGGSYLIYLGYKSLASTSPNATFTNNHQDHVSIRSSFYSGFITNILNPKAFLFYISLYTVILTPETPSWVYVTLAICFVSTTLIWFSLVSMVADSPRFKNKFHQHETHTMRLFGYIMMAFGVYVLLS